MLNILVTGGTGFVGANLCHRLIADGHRVICLDNNYTGSLDNVRDLMDNPRFRFVGHDVIYPYESPEKLHRIYNLACPASPPAYQNSRSIFTTKTCVLGALNMLDLAKKHSARILLSSTSEVYGEPLVHPQVESYRGNVNPIGIRSCYDEGKRCAETLFNCYRMQCDLPIKIVRIFNTYGPNMHPHDGRVVSNFILQALQNKDITLYGDGSQTRSFCYRDDLLEGMVRMMATPDEVTGPVNLGMPQEFTIRELAELTIKLTNSNSRIIYCDLPADDPKQRKPDITKAKELLNWQPTTPLAEGLQKTIEYFDDLLKSDPDFCLN